jgi:hypothetical protein
MIEPQAAPLGWTIIDPADPDHPIRNGEGKPWRFLSQGQASYIVGLSHRGQEVPIEAGTPLADFFLRYEADARQAEEEKNAERLKTSRELALQAAERARAARERGEEQDRLDFLKAAAEKSFGAFRDRLTCPRDAGLGEAFFGLPEKVDTLAQAVLGEAQEQWQAGEAYAQWQRLLPVRERLEQRVAQLRKKAEAEAGAYAESLATADADELLAAEKKRAAADKAAADAESHLAGWLRGTFLVAENAARADRQARIRQPCQAAHEAAWRRFEEARNRAALAVAGGLAEAELALRVSRRLRDEGAAPPALPPA